MKYRRNEPVPVAVRLERYVSIVPITGCWMWLGGINRNGYAKMHVIWSRVEDGRTDVDHEGHRVAYKHFVGPIPKGAELDHLCRNRWCVNPAHLDPVTRRENSIRGTGFAARHARKTACHKGHPFTEQNTYRTPAGGRTCRACQRFNVRAYQRRLALRTAEAAQ